MSKLKSTSETLPRWDVSNVYSSLEGDDYRAAFAELDGSLTSLESSFDENGVRRLPNAPGDDAATIGDLTATLAEAIKQTNEVARRYETLESFVHAFFSTNSYDAVAARETSRLEVLDTRRQNLTVRLKGWIGSLAEVLDLLIPKSPILAEHAFFLRDTAEQSRYLMGEALEALAAEMCLDGGSAFSKLQGNVTSQLKVAWEKDDRTELVPITVIRNLSFDPDEAIRKRAYDAEQQGWTSIRTSVAACLNGVKGTALTLAKRRGWPSVLDAALVQNRIDRPTLDALLGTICEAFPLFRRYLRAKAKKLGKEQLAWWDIFAPVGKSHRTFTWTEAKQFIIEKFGAFSDDMGNFARRSFDENWIDAEPRDGKRGGAFCMPVVGVDESRVLMNFDGSFEQVSTLAHELGHAYHNECQAGLPPLRRGAPSTLAETASIFCETLVAEASLAEAAPDERTMILEIQLCGATQVCLDISSRFLFESAVLAKRADAELSPDEICGLMLDAQRETYCDAVAAETYHPYMWLWKPHYYRHSDNFYNFPYAFGHLFALGLYAIYRREGAEFVAEYRQLLRDTAQAHAAPLAARFDLDITQPEFWRGSLRIIEDQLRRYETS